MPCGITQHDYWLAPRRFGVRGLQGSSYRGSGSKHLEVVACDEIADHQVAFDTNHELVAAKNFREDRILLLEILKLVPRKPMSYTSLIAPRVAIEAVGIAHSQRPKYVGIEHSEQRGVQSKPHGDRDDDTEREHGCPAKSANGIAD